MDLLKVGMEPELSLCCLDAVGKRTASCGKNENLVTTHNLLFKETNLINSYLIIHII